VPIPFRQGLIDSGTGVFASEHRDAYDVLYGEYLRLHDLFGRGGDDVMRRLKRLQIEATAVAPATA